MIDVVSYLEELEEKRHLCLQWIYLECWLSCSAASVCDPQSVLLNSILLCYRYEKYAQMNGWKFDVIDIMESAVKGYKVQPLFGYMHMVFHCNQDIVTILRFGSSETLNSYFPIVIHLYEGS